jgi:hypothetical protein
MRGTACCLPYEIVETILTHVLHDLDTRKALSLTCASGIQSPWLALLLHLSERSDSDVRPFEHLLLHPRC